jgi:NAD(P)-dependent dehydrogenase (short-subunit alcohol dehydrogenase family)
VINHGVSTPHSIDQDDADAIFDAIIAANLTAIWRTARAVVPALRANGTGAIVITSSAAGMRAFGGLPGYIASKQGVLGLMQALAIELAPSNIRVIAVCPGTWPCPCCTTHSCSRCSPVASRTPRRTTWSSQGHEPAGDPMGGT